MSFVFTLSKKEKIQLAGNPSLSIAKTKKIFFCSSFAVQAHDVIGTNKIKDWRLQMVVSFKEYNPQVVKWRANNKLLFYMDVLALNYFATLPTSKRIALNKKKLKQRSRWKYHFLVTKSTEMNFLKCLLLDLQKRYSGCFWRVITLWQKFSASFHNKRKFSDSFILLFITIYGATIFKIDD